MRPLLIKGAATARVLGASPLCRSSADLDLMVARPSLAAARAALESAGFRPLATRDRWAADWWKHAEVWKRGKPFEVEIDLHRSLPRAENAEAVFEALSRDAQTIEIGPVRVRTPSDAGCTLIIALHAAVHGPARERSLDDLRRAVSVVTEATWRDAASLAAEVGLTSSFAFGLRLVDNGGALADRLGVRGSGTFGDRLRAGGIEDDGAIWIDRVRNAPSRRAAASTLYDALFPTPSSVRARHPELGSSRMALCEYYVRRLLRIPRATTQYTRARALARRK